MSKIAIVGSGISGLSAAWLLTRHHEVTLYERASRAGGHSRTLTIRHRDRDIAVDTGFIVFNERNYPNLTALFRQLDVPVKQSDMSFALTVRDGWLEWGAKDLGAVLGQRRNLVRPQFLALLADVMRFNRDAVGQAAEMPNATVGDLVTQMKLGDWFRRHYLLPMAGAIWSCPPCEMMKFPAQALINFFDNHSLLSASGQPQWLTVDGGSQVYVDRMVADLAGRVRTSCGVQYVLRQPQGVEIVDAQGGRERFDHLVLACHSDQALALLGDATEQERVALSAIRYQDNVALLHSDPRFMPRRKACWASWVYHSDGRAEEPAISVSYWMNNLQGIDKRYPVFLTLNPAQAVPEERVFDRHVFEHPVFDFAALAAQRMLAEMQGQRRTWFCGAWLGHGFHEDGLVSAMHVAERLGVSAPWSAAKRASWERTSVENLPLPQAAFSPAPARA